jgi:glycosyltransferase involved in cell wall biosynthesis
VANGSKIKLLIFTPTLQCGGTEKFVSTLCNNIDTAQFAVSLVVLNNANPFYKITNTAVEVIDLGTGRVRNSLFPIKKLVNKARPDIIFSTANHLNLLFAIFRRWFPENIKFVARESSIVSINSQRAPMPWLYNRLIKKYYKRFDFIICQSAYMQQDLIHNYNIPAGKTAVAYNPTEEKSISNSANTGHDNSKTSKFVSVARLSEEKGIGRLIHATGLLTLPFKFYIIGDGDQRTKLESLINELQLQDTVFLLGEKAEPFSGMEDADLFLMGSYYEGLPNVLMEAGMLGIPVIAFNAPGGIPEVISEENGILVDDNDILGFASAIREGLSAKFKRDIITENTRKRFSVHVVVPQIEKLLLQQAEQNK